MHSSPAHCRIVVRHSRGAYSGHFLETLPLQMEVEEGRKAMTFIGHPIDLAAFLGVLQMFLDIGLPVVAVEYAEDNAEGADPQATPGGQ